MATKAPKGAGSKLGRTETVSIRLDPRLNYLCELAARSQRRTKSSFIEATLAEHVQGQPINKWKKPVSGEPDTFGSRADLLWHVRESQRLVSLAIIAPELMTIDEQEIWALIEENPYFWRGSYQSSEGKWVFDISLENIRRDRVERHWYDLVDVADGVENSSILPREVTSVARSILPLKEK